MKSPVAPTTTLVRTELEPGLDAFQCPESGGHYLPPESYWRWLGKHPERLPKLPASGDELPQEEPASDLRLCPKSGLPMLRYRVGHGFNFTIDRSPTGGLWFDKGEWEALRAHNFHDELHLIFTLPWQNKVRQEAGAQAMIENLKKRIGEDSTAKVQDFKSWLDTQDEQAVILAFLGNS